MGQYKVIISYCSALLIFSSKPANNIIIANPIISPMFCSRIKHRCFSDFEDMVANISGTYKRKKKDRKQQPWLIIMDDIIFQCFQVFFLCCFSTKSSLTYNVSVISIISRDEYKNRAF